MTPGSQTASGRRRTATSSGEPLVFPEKLLQRLLPGRVPYADRAVREHAHWWARHLGAALSRGLYRTQVIGADRIPASGGAIIAANHIGLLDGPLLYAALPREGHILVKREMLISPAGGILHHSGQIGLNRAGDRRALTVARELLGKGKLMGILPEGTRGQGSVEQISTGVAWLAATSGAPVLPAAILGTRASGRDKNWLPPLRTRLAVVIGEPILPAQVQASSGRERMGLIAEQIRLSLHSHVAAAQELTGLALPEH